MSELINILKCEIESLSDMDKNSDNGIMTQIRLARIGLYRNIINELSASQAREAELQKKLKVMEASLCDWRKSYEQCYDDAHHWMKRAEASEAIIKAAREQGCVGEVLEFLGDEKFVVRINRPTNVGEFLFAESSITPDVEALKRENEEWQERMKEKIRITDELTRKLAEKQATIKKALSTSPVDHIPRPDGGGVMTVYSILEEQLGSGSEELTRLIEEAKKQAVPELFSVKDKLPDTKYELDGSEVSQSVLLLGKCVAGYDGHGIGHYSSDGTWTCYEGEYDNQNIVEVTHWMRLPAAPQPPKE